jgi:hypothetical protein
MGCAVGNCVVFVMWVCVFKSNEVLDLCMGCGFCVNPFWQCECLICQV